MNGVTDGLDFLCLFVWDGDSELLFQFHHQLHHIKRVCSNLFKERCCGGDPLLAHSQFLADALKDFVPERCYSLRLVEPHPRRRIEEPKQHATVRAWCIPWRVGWLDVNGGVADRAVVWGTFR